MAKIKVETKKCPACKQSVILEVEKADYQDWQVGALIQDAMPYLSIHDRERLITGYCSPCWDAIFKDDDEEVDG